MQPENQNQDGNWAYRPETPDPAPQPQQQQYESTQYANEQPYADQYLPLPEVSWTASEFISHHKDAKWYGVVGGGSVMLGIIIYLITKDLFSVLFIGIVVILFMVIGAKKPQQRNYTVDEQGISIDGKLFPYNLYKSFAVAGQGHIGSVVFMPLKRFTLELTVYFPPEEEQNIIEVIGSNLPNDQRGAQTSENLMRRLRF